MESINTEALIELVLQTGSIVDSQFQFWLAITFALIVASFSAGEKIPRNIRLVISVTYIAASVLLYIRIGVAVLNTNPMEAEIISRGITWIPVFNTGAAILRTFVMLAGVGSALWYLFKSTESSES